MKGITPVIAIILLLLITISMVGFAFVWFGRISTILTNQTESELTGQHNLQCQRVSIDSISAANAMVYIKNIGTCNIKKESLQVYVSGVLQPLSGACSELTDIAPGAVTNCDWIDPAACTTGTVVKVTAPGNSDETTC